MLRQAGTDPSLSFVSVRAGHDQLMRIVVIVLGVLAAVAVIAAVMIRRLDHDAGVWHVDPLTAPKPSTPNSYRVAPADSGIDADAVAPVFNMSTKELAAKFDRVARDSGNVDVVGGSPESGFVTYVQTSTLFAFPDYISVKFIEIDANTSTLAVLSRSRLGQSDLGVNEKRITAWLAQLG